MLYVKNIVNTFLVKLSVRIAVYVHCLSDNIYLKLLPHFGQIGKMLDGWLKDGQRTSPAVARQTNYQT